MLQESSREPYELHASKFPELTAVVFFVTPTSEMSTVVANNTILKIPDLAFGFDHGLIWMMDHCICLDHTCILVAHQLFPCNSFIYTDLLLTDFVSS